MLVAHVCPSISRLEVGRSVPVTLGGGCSGEAEPARCCRRPSGAAAAGRPLRRTCLRLRVCIMMVPWGARTTGNKVDGTSERVPREPTAPPGTRPAGGTCQSLLVQLHMPAGFGCHVCMAGPLQHGIATLESL